jgi:hypothetical protein
MERIVSEAVKEVVKYGEVMKYILSRLSLTLKITDLQSFRKNGFVKKRI